MKGVEVPQFFTVILVINLAPENACFLTSKSSLWTGHIDIIWISIKVTSIANNRCKNQRQQFWSLQSLLSLYFNNSMTKIICFSKWSAISVDHNVLVSEIEVTIVFTIFWRFTSKRTNFIQYVKVEKNRTDLKFQKKTSFDLCCGYG